MTQTGNLATTDKEGIEICPSQHYLKSVPNANPENKINKATSSVSPIYKYWQNRILFSLVFGYAA
jgi:hypothetical protein